MLCWTIQRAHTSECSSACRCVCVLCLHVILSLQWQVRESNVMRLSSLWFKHEHGKMETERERISLVSWGSEIKRDWAYSCVPVCHVLLQGKPCDKKDAFLHLCMDSFYRLLYSLCLSAQGMKNIIKKQHFQLHYKSAVWISGLMLRFETILRPYVTLMMTPYGMYVIVPCVCL